MFSSLQFFHEGIYIDAHIQSDMEIQMLAGFLALVMMITYLAIHFSSREVDASPIRRKMTIQNGTLSLKTNSKLRTPGYLIERLKNRPHANESIIQESQSIRYKQCFWNIFA